MTAVDTAGNPVGLGQRSLFLVWGPPSHGRRTKVFAQALGVAAVHVYATRRRGLLIAPWKYSYQAIATLVILARRRPRVVFVQSPPSLAVPVVWVYAALSRARFVVDAHSDALDSRVWTWPGWLHAFLARRAAVTVVTNEHFAARIAAQGGRAVVIRDIPGTFPVGEPPALEGAVRVMVVNSFAPDEPILDIVAAAAALPDVTFYVTGDPNRPGATLPDVIPSNVHLTGYLPDGAFYGLMHASHAVLCLTTRDHTMQRGACEALSMGRPIVTSDWPLLRQYFSKGTVHVGADAQSIRLGVERVLRDHDRYSREILVLRDEQAHQWEAARAALEAALAA
jgi:glycosyltransferase involved in cell wall biosynthesis